MANRRLRRPVTKQPSGVRQFRAFTLVELLVVVSIIALLISILLPSLKGARESATQVACGALLAGHGKGLQTYGAEEREWIPGINTSGIELWKRVLDNKNLQMSNLPVQTYDWISPLLRVQSKLPNGRPERFRIIADKYKCPAVKEKCGYWTKVSPRPPDQPLFQAETAGDRTLYSSSYLMPYLFQLFGKNNYTSYGFAGPRIPLNAKLAPDAWEVEVRQYTSRLNKVGSPAEKIAGADGTRFYDPEDGLSYNHQPAPSGEFGSFTTGGAWWRQNREYGDQSNTKGAQIPLTYRHKKGIQAMFFDSHVEHISQKQSHRIDYWYPKGAILRTPNEGWPDAPAYPQDYVIR